MISGAPELRRIHYATRALEHDLLMHIDTYKSAITYPTALPTPCSGNFADPCGVHCMTQKCMMVSVITEASEPKSSAELVGVNVMDDVAGWLRIQHESMG